MQKLQQRKSQRRKLQRTVFAFIAVLLCVPTGAFAHFLWLIPSKDGKKLHLYFSEAAEADDPDLLKYAKGVAVRQITPQGTIKKLTLQLGKESYFANLNSKTDDKSVFVLHHELGVMSHGRIPFLVQYYAKTGPTFQGTNWKPAAFHKQLDLDVTPYWGKGGFRIKALWKGKPVAGVEVTFAGNGADDQLKTTDASGTASFKLGKTGVYSIRAKHIIKTAGVHNGKKYREVRHYCTLSLPVVRRDFGSVSREENSDRPGDYADLPKAITSFGAAISEDNAYVYGGHMGGAHSYSIEGQSNILHCLELTNKKSQWKALNTGPKLQGLAMVSYGGKLYRVGGFTAKNKKGEKHFLVSQNAVDCYDIKTKKWTAMPPLPEPRSSLDAAMIGSHLYVAGGWAMDGRGKSVWHNSAWVMDVAAEQPHWKPLSRPNFQRRALALAAHKGKLYLIGGMQKEEGPTTKVNCYDPATNKWSEAPKLHGKPMEGFGCSAFAASGKLYVSTLYGNLQQLSDDGKSWKIVHSLDRARFFHRMLPMKGQKKFLLVGGANMSVGKFPEVDVLDLRKLKTPKPKAVQKKKPATTEASQK